MFPEPVTRVHQAAVVAAEVGYLAARDQSSQANGRLVKLSQSATLLLDPVPGGQFEVYGFDADAVGQTQRMVQLCTDGGARKLVVNLLPHDFTPDVHAALAAAGLVPRWTDVWLLAPRQAVPVVAPKLPVVNVTGADQLVPFIEAYLQGFDPKASVSPLRMEHARGSWLVDDRVHFFAVPDEAGGYASASALFMHSSEIGLIGYLAAGCTREACRGRGMQQATIAARVARAHELGADWIAAAAACQGPSNRNLQRAGLRPIGNGLIYFRDLPG